MCGAGLSPSEGKLSSALIPRPFFCWRQQRNLCRIDDIFALNASEPSEQRSLNASVVLRGIPQTSGPSPKGCFPPLSTAAGLKVSLLGRPALPEPSRARFKDVELHKAFVGWWWVGAPSERNELSFVASSFKHSLFSQARWEGNPSDGSPCARNDSLF